MFQALAQASLFKSSRSCYWTSLHYCYAAFGAALFQGLGLRQQCAVGPALSAWPAAKGVELHRAASSISFQVAMRHICLLQPRQLSAMLQAQTPGASGMTKNRKKRGRRASGATTNRTKRGRQVPYRMGHSPREAETAIVELLGFVSVSFWVSL